MFHVRSKLKASFFVLAVLLAAGCYSSGGSAVSSPERPLPPPEPSEIPGVRAHDLVYDGFNLHYRSAGAAIKGVAVWVHGTPGDWQSIWRLLADPQLTREVLFVSIDRPGWGRSQFFSQPRAVPTFAEQSQLITPLLTQLKEQHPNIPLVLVGHSWGGSLVPSLAAAAPTAVDGVLALAGPFDPAHAKPRWYNRVAKFAPVSWMIGEPLRRSNREMFALPHELRDAAAHWTTLDVPLIVAQGDKDILVPEAHFHFAQSIFPAQSTHFVMLKNQGHLLQVERTPFIRQCLLALLERDLAACEDGKGSE